MNVLLSPLTYLNLKNSSGARSARRDIVACFFITILISLPFVLISGTNFFHADGFLDRIGNFLSVLTGFYVAALIGVASFRTDLTDLDKPIVTGPIYAPSAIIGEDFPLTRREYVCYMFGYLSFMSLILSLVSIVTLSAISGREQLLFVFSFIGIKYAFIRSVSVILFTIPISSLCVTTIRGLYYLIERLYYQEPSIGHPARTEDLVD